MFLILKRDGKPDDWVRARWTAYTGHRGVRSPLWEARGACGCLYRGASLWRCEPHATVRSAELVESLPIETFDARNRAEKGGVLVDGNG